MSLIGPLSSVAKCIPAGQIFLRRGINTFCRAKLLQDRNSLTKDFYCDLRWWREFLLLKSGIASFLNPDWKPANAPNLYKDASRKENFGGFLKGSWYQGS